MTDAVVRRGPVVVLGDALIDEIHDDAGVRDVVGGAALNVAVGLARLGVQTVLVAQVGDDPDGAVIRDFVQRFGVALIATPAPLGSARAVATKIAREARYDFNDAAVERRIEFGPEVLDAIAAAPLVVVSCYPFDRDEPTDDLLASVEDAGRRLIVDPNPRPTLMSDLRAFQRNTDRVARSSRLVKIGDEDAILLLGLDLDEATDRLLDGGAAMVLATAGRQGAFLARRSGRVQAGIVELPGPIVDTIGAGDATLAAITGAVLRSDVQGIDDALYWEGALQNAMTIAAATVRAEGALLQLP